MYGYGDDNGRGGGGGGGGYGGNSGYNGNGGQGDGGYGYGSNQGGRQDRGYGNAPAGSNTQSSPYGNAPSARMPDSSSPGRLGPVTYPRVPPPRSGPVQRAYGVSSPQDQGNNGYQMSPPSNYNTPRPPPQGQYASPPSQYNTPRPPPQGQYSQHAPPQHNSGRTPPSRTPNAPYGSSPAANAYSNSSGRPTPDSIAYNSPNGHQPWSPLVGGAKPAHPEDFYLPGAGRDSEESHEMKQFGRTPTNQSMSPGKILPNQHMAGAPGMSNQYMSPNQSMSNQRMSPGQGAPNQYMSPKQNVPNQQSSLNQDLPMPPQAQKPLPRQDPQWFFGEINRIGRDIDNAQMLLTRLETLKRDVFSSLDQHQIARDINKLSDDAKTTFKTIIADLSRLKATPGAAGQPATQINNKQEKLRKLQETYKLKERELENAARDQMRAQLRIARPELDEEAIAEAVPDASPQQIFANATMQSARQGQATATLGAVKARSEALAKIVQDFQICLELFTEMEQQVLQQEEKIEHVEVKTEDVREDTTKGNEALDGGINKARSARKKKWWCLGIAVLIVVAIAVGILVWKFVFQNQTPGKRRRRSLDASGSSSAAPLSRIYPRANGVEATMHQLLATIVAAMEEPGGV